MTSSTAATGGLTITSGTPPSGYVGKTYLFRCAQTPPCNVVKAGFSLTATGGVQPYSWSWVGAPGSSVPPGLAIWKYRGSGSLCLNIAVPAICGKPTVAGTYHVIVTVRESNNPSIHANAAYTITIFQ